MAGVNIIFNMIKVFRLFILFVLVGSSTGNYVIDVSAIFDNHKSINDKLATIKLIDKALQNDGYFIAINYNNISYLVDASIQSANSLFSLSNELKHKYSIEKLKSFGRGFLLFGKESGVSTYFEVKEGFSYGYSSINEASHPPESLTHPMQQANIWPNGLHTSDISNFEQLYYHKTIFAQAVLNSLARYLGEYFDDKYHNYDQYISTEIDGGELISLMRIFHYFSATPPPPSSTHTPTSSPPPSCNTPSLGEGRELIGSSPHTDWGLLTVITWNGEPGLQFYNTTTHIWNDLVLPDGVSYTDMMIVNGGDYLKLISKGRYRSPIHRVIHPSTTPTTTSTTCTDGNTAQCSSSDPQESQSQSLPSTASKDRLSFVYFFYPRHDSVIPRISTPSPGSDLTVGERVGEVEAGDNDGVRGHFIDFEYNTLQKGESASETVPECVLSQSSTSAVDDDTTRGHSKGGHNSDPYQDSNSINNVDLLFGDYIMSKWQGVYR